MAHIESINASSLVCDSDLISAEIWGLGTINAVLPFTQLYDITTS